MLPRMILGLIFVFQANSLSVLTDDKSPTRERNGETGESEATKSHILKQLLNQETLIRMSLDKKVNDLVKDMDEMKTGMAEMKAGIEKNNKQFQQEIVVLRNELLSLKNEKTKLKTDVLKYQDKMDLTFKVTEENFTQIRDTQEQNERQLNKKFAILETNTTTILDSIKTNVRSLSSSIMDLQSRSTELNTTIRDAVDKQITSFSADWNRSMTEMSHRFVYTWSKMDQDHSNKFMLLSDGINTTINSIKADVAQSQKAQLELASAVSSLEVLRQNMTNSVKETRVGFTAGVTSSSNSWQGDILVFPHVITNKGNNYNRNTGKFTAPRTGTYVFFVTAVSNRNQYIYLAIVHNGHNKVATLSHDSASFQTGTNLAVLELSQGDTVWVSRYTGTGYYTHPVPYTTFSGFLL